MIKKEEIMRLADIIKLYISNEEIEDYAKSLESFVMFANEINSVDAEPCELDNISGLFNILREDVVIPSYNVAQLLENSGGGVDGFFFAPKHKLQ